MKGETLMNEKVMVAGAGKSGIAATKLILETGGEVLLYDGNEALSEEKIRENFPENARLTICLGELDETLLTGIQICVMSPGIDLETPFVRKLTDKKIQLWSEIELGFQVAKGQLLAITGTNGKTTTTALTGAIMQRAFGNSFTVGNIGLPYTEVALKTTEKSITVLEASSFQLETIIRFHPHVAAITNITPDHLNRHHTMENYIRIKEDISSNQTVDDFLVLNYDDEVLRAFGERKDLKPKVVFFSSTQLLLGRHNFENVMTAIAMAVCMKAPMDAILDAVRKFRAVEHRIEFVAERYGVKYYNDSKGTNPDAAIQAIKAMPGPTLLIGGGYDKGSSYDEWIDAFGGKVRYLVLLGQTRDAISDCAKRHGFTNIMFAEDMQEAVKVCASYANAGDYVLLSPACASWGMFPNYEVRGKVFKECVRAL